MQRNKDLHKFLLQKAERLTEEWYDSLDKSDPAGVYSSTDPKVICNLKTQNLEFHKQLCKIFIEEKSVFLKGFDEWVIGIATDKEHLETPTHYILREFMRVRKQYLDFIEEYAASNHREVTQKQVDLWKDVLVEIFDVALLRFTEEKSKYVDGQFEEQQQMINDLSSPIIDLTRGRALLPLVGEIDTIRASAILENTLQQCMDKSVAHLFIDLSGVYMIDTMVAHQIFSLLDGLRLIGVTTSLSGIRPEIAQTAVQLGINFGKITISSSLAQAISKTE